MQRRRSAPSRSATRRDGGRCGAAVEIAAAIGNNNAKGEFYLTDLPGLAAAEGFEPWPITNVADASGLGVNTRVQLAAIEAALQHRRGMPPCSTAQPWSHPRRCSCRPIPTWPGCPRRAACGVRQPASKSATGRKSAASAISSGPPSARRRWLVPFARLRPGATLARNVHIGNFVEVKQAVIAEGSQDQPSRLYRRCPGRGGGQCRGRRHHLQLRWRRQEFDRDRSWRLHRHQCLAGRSGQGRRGGVRRRRERRHRRC